MSDSDWQKYIDSLPMGIERINIEIQYNILREARAKARAEEAKARAEEARTKNEEKRLGEEIKRATPPPLPPKPNINKNKPLPKPPKLPSKPLPAPPKLARKPLPEKPKIVESGLPQIFGDFTRAINKTGIPEPVSGVNERETKPKIVGRVPATPIILGEVNQPVGLPQIIGDFTRAINEPLRVVSDRVPARPVIIPGLTLDNKPKIEDVQEQNLGLPINTKYLTLDVKKPKFRYIESEILNQLNRKLTSGARIKPQLINDAIRVLDDTRREIEARGNRAMVKVNTISQQLVASVTQYNIDDVLLNQIYNNLVNGFEEEVEYIPGSDVDDILTYNRMLNIWIVEIMGRGKQNFGYFRYLHNTKLNLERYQIYSEEQMNEYVAKPDNLDTEPGMQCLVYAIVKEGKTESDKVKAVANLMSGGVKWKKREKKLFNQISEILGRRLVITHLDKDNRKRRVTYGNNVDEAEDLKLGIVDEHCFLHEETKYCKNDVKEECESKVLLDSINLVKYMNKEGCFFTSNLLKYSGYEKISEFKLLDDVSSEQREIDNHDPKVFIPDWEEKYDIEERKKANGGQYTEEDQRTIDRWNQIMKEQAEEAKSKEKGREYYEDKEGIKYKAKIFMEADFECNVLDRVIVNNELTPDYHKPMALVCTPFIIKDGHKEVDKIISWKPMMFGVGYNCVEQFLRRLNKQHDKIVEKIKSIEDMSDESEYTYVILFHNVKYDFMASVGEMIKCGCKFKDICKKGSQIYSVKLDYMGINIELRDSYKLIPESVANIGIKFKLENQKSKGVTFKYDYIRAKSRVSFEEYAKYLEDDERVHFYNNLNDNNIIIAAGVDHSTRTFSAKGYLLYYCYKDVEVVIEGLMKFRDALMTVNASIDILDCLTISSYANKVIKSIGALEGVYEMKGGLRNFCSKPANGGRVFCNPRFKGIIINEQIESLDFTSLYPSAMEELCIKHGLPRGRAKRIENVDSGLIHTTALDIGDYYHVRIIIESMISRETPVIMAKDAKGNIYYHNEAVEGGIDVVVDKFTLEEYVRYHRIQYRIIEGVYWNKGFNKIIGGQMQVWFNQRNLTRHNNPALGEAYKLMMNSSYGKLLMKLEMSKESVQQCDRVEIMRDAEGKKIKDANGKYVKEVVKDGNLNRYILNNGERISSIKILENGYFIGKTYANINNEYNSVHCAAAILSTSKVIVNRVFDVCEKVGCNIYYSDTDSIHVPLNKVEQIYNKFQELYGRPIEGNVLGRMHGDLKLNVNGSEKPAIAKRAIYIGRKIYSEELQRVGGTETGYLMKCKGIPNKALKYKCENEYGGDAIQMYKEAFDRTNTEDPMMVECIVPGVAGMKFDYMVGVTHNLSLQKVLRST